MGSILGQVGFRSNGNLRRFCLKKSTKIVLVLFIFLIFAAGPLYYYTRPETTQNDTLQIKGKVNNPTILTLSQLKTQQSSTIQVTLSSSSKPSDNGVYNYTGVQLPELLAQANTLDSATFVYIQASDGYGTTIPIQDAMNQNTIIAYQRNSTSLTALKNGGEGPLRLIIGSDQFAQRWVRGVVAIEVR
jgi:DMSO/TMAO reductase YedYZ molybdopterin-dependent catalytic subunit